MQLELWNHTNVPFNLLLRAQLQQWLQTVVMRDNSHAETSSTSWKTCDHSHPYLLFLFNSILFSLTHF